MDERKDFMFSRKDLQRLIIPLIVEQFLSITIGMADTVMVSVCGEAAVSGVSLVDAINILMINIFSALATGGAIVSSQYIGREDLGKACEAAKQLVLAVFVLSTAIGAIFVFGGPQVLGLLYHDIEADVMASAESYFFLTALSYPFIALYNAGAALFRAMGNSKVSMTISIVMNCINIGGNALFIFGFDMGAAGAALATLISYMVVFVLRAIDTHRFIPMRFSPTRLVFNTVVLLAQAVIMIFEIKGWILFEAALTLLMIIANLSALWATARKVLFSRAREN